MDDRNPIIERAISLAGGTQARLAEASGLSQQYISKLLSRSKFVSVHAAIAISNATGGAVLISELLPDVVEAVALELKNAPTPSREVAA